MDFNYQGIWRMDWGLGNPNITAALIVTLMTGVWILGWIHRKGFWVALPLFAVLEICLIHTMSRGGLLAAFAGLGILIWFAPRPWPKPRWIALLITFWIGIMFVIFLNAHQRFGQGLVQEDKSISNRLVIWKEVPRMLADAPGGWGINGAGDAYMAWYQSPERHEFYGSLVNTHLTKLVELGVWGGTAYLLAWILAFWICWPDKKNKWPAVSLAVVVGFATAAMFTNMGREPKVWIIPGTAVVLTAIVRVWRKERPSFRPMIAGAILASGATAILFLIGKSMRPFEISASSQAVVWNAAESGNWLLVDKKVIGKQYPKTWRAIWEKNEAFENVSFGFALEPGALPDTVEKLVIAGKPPLNFIKQMRNPASVRLLLLNPAFGPSLLGNFPLKNVEVVAGEFNASAFQDEWKKSAKYTAVEGAGEFLASWPVFVVEFIRGKQ